MATFTVVVAVAVAVGAAKGAGGIGALEIAEPVIGGRLSETIGADTGAARGVAAASSIAGSTPGVAALRAGGVGGMWVGYGLALA
jgi:hypothetical protein